MAKRYHILILALLLTSCVSLGHTVRLNDIETVPGQEALVFGRVKVVKNGESLNWSSSFFRTSSFRIHILPEASPESVPYHYYLRGDGSFYWPLSAGGYTITDFDSVETTWRYWAATQKKVIFARFIVSEETPLIYIGTLTIHSEAGRYTTGIEDEYDKALQRLKQRFPEIRGPVTKRLMQLKEQR